MGLSGSRGVGGWDGSWMDKEAEGGGLPPPLSPPQRQQVQPTFQGQSSASDPGDWAAVAQLQAFAFVGERGSSIPHSGAVPTRKASLGPWVEPCSPLSP